MVEPAEGTVGFHPVPLRWHRISGKIAPVRPPIVPHRAQVLQPRSSDDPQDRMFQVSQRIGRGSKDSHQFAARDVVAHSLAEVCR